MKFYTFPFANHIGSSKCDRHRWKIVRVVYSQCLPPGPGQEQELGLILCKNHSHWLCLGPGLDTWNPLKYNWNTPPDTVSGPEKWVHNHFFPVPVQCSVKGSTQNHTTHSSWSRSRFLSWSRRQPVVLQALRFLLLINRKEWNVRCWRRSWADADTVWVLTRMALQNSSSETNMVNYHNRYLATNNDVSHLLFKICKNTINLVFFAMLLRGFSGLFGNKFSSAHHQGVLEAS